MNIQIDQTISSFTSVNLKSNMPKARNLPLLRYQADNTLLFDGNLKLLNCFIICCENLIRTFQSNDQNDPVNTCLFDNMFADLISLYSDLDTGRKSKKLFIFCRTT